MLNDDSKEVGDFNTEIMRLLGQDQISEVDGIID
jgi:hypothetical protein